MNPSLRLAVKGRMSPLGEKSGTEGKVNLVLGKPYPLITPGQPDHPDLMMQDPAQRTPRSWKANKPGPTHA